MERTYLDLDILMNSRLLMDKTIIVYGAGMNGRKASKMLCDLGYVGYAFCDMDETKQGKHYCGGRVYSVKEIERMDNLLVVISVSNPVFQSEAEEALENIKGIKFVSFFALTLLWIYLASHYVSSSITSRLGRLSFWYSRMSSGMELIQNACEKPVLVFQNGKVGSRSIYNGLINAGVDAVHIHRMFFQHDIVRELMINAMGRDFVDNRNIFSNPEHAELIKKEMKHKKIITMVRDPVSVALSTVFQWMGSEITNSYIAEKIQSGEDFMMAVVELMKKLQNRLFDWFDDELKELTGIDIFRHPFDREKGYGIIRNNDFEILVMKTEKISSLENVIREFAGNENYATRNENVGDAKDYKHLYKAVKKEIRLPQDFIDFYYKGNDRVDFFYTAEEKEKFIKKWTHM